MNDYKISKTSYMTGKGKKNNLKIENFYSKITVQSF